MDQQISKEQLPVELGISEEEFLRESQENRPFERDEMVIPFLRILQPLSPAAQEDSPDYIHGAKPGMFHNVSNGMIYSGKDGIILVPISHQKNYTEWKPNQGGFVKDWGESLDWQKTCERNQLTAYRPATKAGTEIVYSLFMFVMIVNPEEGTFDPVIMPFTGTQIKKMRAWASNMLAAKVMTSQGLRVAPYHYFTYLAATIKESNEKGSWYGIKIAPRIGADGKRIRTFDLPDGTSIYNAAKAFKQSLNEGTIRTATPDFEPTGERNGGDQGDEVPF